MKRISWTEYYLNIAKAVSCRSTCLRRKYGAIIVKDGHIVSSGYNGSPSGDENCCDLDDCPRNTLKIPKGERYELCRAVHAEQNAIINASPADLKGSTLYIYGENVDGTLASGAPCLICAKFITNAHIKHTIYKDETGKLHSLNDKNVE